MWLIKITNHGRSYINPVIYACVFEFFIHLPRIQPITKNLFIIRLILSVILLHWRCVFTTEAHETNTIGFMQADAH